MTYLFKRILLPFLSAVLCGTVMGVCAGAEEIAEITAGTVYDYAESSARDSWPAVSAYSEGDVLPKTYATDMRPLLFTQLRNGGYRLAAIFNDIFR